MFVSYAERQQVLCINSWRPQLQELFHCTWEVNTSDRSEPRDVYLMRLAEPMWAEHPPGNVSEKLDKCIEQLSI